MVTGGDITLLGTILIVEDSISQLELMVHYLQDSVDRIIKSHSAKEAMKIAVQEEIDLIITDIVMPEMSGFEFCRFLKKNPVTNKIPIILCSSKNKEIDYLWGFKQGADFYVTKPFTREELLSALETVQRKMKSELGAKHA